MISILLDKARKHLQRHHLRPIHSLNLPLYRLFFGHHVVEYLFSNLDLHFLRFLLIPFACDALLGGLDDPLPRIFNIFLHVRLVFILYRFRSSR